MKLLLLLLLLASAQPLPHSVAGAAETRQRSRATAESPSVWKGSWQAAQRWCSDHGLGGLAQLATGDAARRRLAVRLPVDRGGCYWVAAESAAVQEELRWAADSELAGSDDSVGGCLCLRQPAPAGRGAPGLRLVDCHRRLPFLCRRQPPEKHEEQLLTSPKPKPASPATARSPDEFVPDETADDPDGMLDEPVDHAKFPLSDLRPGARMLPPQVAPTTAAAQKSPLRGSTAAIGGNGSDATTTAAAPATRFSLLSDSQRSEFITLVALYAVVGVVCCVLLVLCVVRCCRGRCGKARIRYVKQVDADDIPRFMPSSWA